MTFLAAAAMLFLRPACVASFSRRQIQKKRRQGRLQQIVEYHAQGMVYPDMCKRDTMHHYPPSVKRVVKKPLRNRVKTARVPRMAGKEAPYTHTDSAHEAMAFDRLVREIATAGIKTAYACTKQTPD